MRTPIAPEHYGGNLYLTDEEGSVSVRVGCPKGAPALYLDSSLLEALQRYAARISVAEAAWARDLKAVYVYPDEEQYDFPPAWKSDDYGTRGADIRRDYEIRKTDVCGDCDEELKIHYGEPLASCRCGVQEWPR